MSEEEKIFKIFKGELVIPGMTRDVRDKWFKNMIREYIHINKENKELKENFKKQSYCRYGNTCDDSWDCTYEEYHTMCEQNTKLSILPNELENWLVNFRTKLVNETDNILDDRIDKKLLDKKSIDCVFKCILDKLNELKGSDE